MNNISSFLERFKHILSSSVAVKQTIVEILFEQCGVQVPLKDIKISGHTLYIQSKPALKSAVFLKKKQILSLLKQQTGSSIVDIR